MQTPTPHTNQTVARRWSAFSSLQAKITALVFAAMMVLVAILSTYLPSQHVASVRRLLENKANTYATLLSKGVEPVLAFDDLETAREEFATYALDSDVLAVGVYDARGRAVFVQGELDPPSRGSSAARAQWSDEDLRVEAPVRAKEGARGTLVLRISARSLIEERERVTRTSIVVGGIAGGLGLLSAWWIGRSFGRRVARVSSAARAVASGHLEQTVPEDATRDEIGDLATAFQEMLAKIRGLMATLAENARLETARLDALVAERTASLGSKTNELRQVLEHLGEGFFTLDPSGGISEERAAVLTDWLGQAAPGTKLWSYLGRVDPRAGAWAQTTWDELVAGDLPVDVVLDQLPKSVQAGTISLQARYRPILTGDTLQRVLVVLKDATADLAAGQAEAKRRDAVAALGQLLRDRPGFLEFVAEGNRLLEAMSSPTVSVVDRARALHTLKGTSGVFGLVHLSAMCHQLEDQLAAGDGAAKVLSANIDDHWRETCAALGTLSVNASLDVDATDYDALVSAIQSGGSADTLLGLMRSWHLERAELRLVRVAEQAKAFAARLGKAIVVDVHATGVRLDAQRFGPLWSSLIHVIRNAVDHGIESPDERSRAGKSPEGHIGLRVSIESNLVAIEVCDDGRGIDWGAIAERARRAGLPADTRRDLEDALFAEGLSTRDVATPESGRGIGMNAVQEACWALGGTIGVFDRHPGTAFRVLVPQDIPSKSNAWAKRVRSVVKARGAA